MGCYNGTTMKSYQEIHGITSITYDTTMRYHQEVHGITSITSNTAMKSHQEFHGITSISYHIHVSPTNHRFIKRNNLMPISNKPTNNSCFPFHTQHNKISLSFNLTQHTWHHTSCVYDKKHPIRQASTTLENKSKLEHETCPSLT